MSLCLSNHAHLTLLLFLLYMSLCSSASTSLCTIFISSPQSVSLFSHPSLQFFNAYFTFSTLSLLCLSCFCFCSSCASCRIGLILGAKQCAMTHKQLQLQYYRVRGSHRERDTSCVLQSNELPRQYFKSSWMRCRRESCAKR